MRLPSSLSPGPTLRREHRTDPREPRTPEIRFSNSRKRPYFYNPASQESRWEVPADLASTDLSTLPGAEHLAYQGQGASADASKAKAAGPGAGSNKVRASHLLVKHSGSRRPSSWREANITRSKEDAVDILRQHEKTLKDAPNLREAFAKLASTESDCSSARDGGDLGAPRLLGRLSVLRHCDMLISLVPKHRLLRAEPDAEAVRGRLVRARGRPAERDRCALLCSRRYLRKPSLTSCDTCARAVSTDSGVHLILRTA